MVKLSYTKSEGLWAQIVSLWPTTLEERPCLSKALLSTIRQFGAPHVPNKQGESSSPFHQHWKKTSWDMQELERLGLRWIKRLSQVNFI